MAEACSVTELKARIVALEAGLAAFKDLMEERDKRYEQRAHFQDEAVEIAQDASKEAIEKAEKATEKRLETLNELRGVVVDQSADFSRKAEVKLLIDGLEKRVDVMAGIVNTREGHGGGIKDTIMYVLAILGPLVAAMAIFYHR